MTKTQIRWIIGICIGIFLICIADSYFKPKRPIENLRNRTSEIIDSLKIEQNAKETAKIDSVANYYIQVVDSIKKIKTKAKIAYITIKQDTTATDSAKLTECDNYVGVLESVTQSQDSAITYLEESKLKRDSTIKLQSHVMVSLKDSNYGLRVQNSYLAKNQKPPLWQSLVSTILKLGTGYAVGKIF